MPPAPTTHEEVRMRFCATKPPGTAWALVVVIVKDVPPLAVTVGGEKTQAEPDGKPEQEKLIIPANPFVGKT